ncbi:MAG TPA: GGDEF domain-containing protein, partial [Treponema sp.]|nr:GGDEF domain-containing protein [Treponema sp.]
ETLTPVIAYEEGRIYNGYRFVYPLIYNGIHCGSVEISFSMKSFITILSQLEASDYYFGIKKSAVEDVLFKENRYRYIDSFFSPNFLFDQEVIPTNTNDEIFTNSSNELTSILDSDTSGGYVVAYKGKQKLVLVNFIQNLAGDPVACFISVSDETVHEKLARDNWQVSAISLIIFIVLVVTAFLLIKEREKLKFLSLTDMLTGLNNRNAILHIMEHELDRAKRYKRALSIMMIDIDNFKQVNDRYGHAEGDEVLRNLAKLMRSALRTSDYASRWGGEEFLVLLTDTSFEAATIASEKFCAEVSSSYLSNFIPVTVSIGVSTYVDVDTIDSLVARADKALYDAKRQGKNRVVGIKKA